MSVALQHGTVVEQVWLVWAHDDEGALWHVPLVAPGAIEHERLAQQSLFTVQPWPELEQAAIGGVPPPPDVLGSAQSPSTQVWLQQSVAAVAVVHAPPVSLHVGDELGRRHA